MIIENGIAKFGGNSHMEFFAEFVLKLGSKITAWGNKIMSRHKPLLVSNPTVKLCNPFTLIVSFTVNGNEKYQVVLEGNYKELYKDKIKKANEINEDNNDTNTENESIDLTDKELFSIIEANQKNWFKKG